MPEVMTARSSCQSAPPSDPPVSLPVIPAPSGATGPGPASARTRAASVTIPGPSELSWSSSSAQLTPRLEAHSRPWSSAAAKPEIGVVPPGVDLAPLDQLADLGLFRRRGSVVHDEQR